MIIAIVISTAIHFVIGPFFSRWHALQITQGQPPAEFVVTSSAVKLERHLTPQPQAQKKSRIQHPQTQRQRIRQQIITPRMRVELTPRPHELARLDPKAVEHQPLAPKEQSAQQQSQSRQEQQEFEKAIAQAKAEGNPLKVAPAPAAAPRRYALEFNGKNNPLQSGEGILYPRKTYKEGAETCYYVDYTMVFSDGARDEGHVPWPICYTTKGDPFLNHFEHFPLPSPRPGYVLPPSELPLNPTLRPYFPDLYPNG
ncbi:MAG: hypothetical protein ABR584_06185 [Candidatus Baltobacteraceae bacterium]